MTRAAADALMAIFGLLPVDPAAEEMVARLVADNTPAPTTKRKLERRKR